MAFPADSTINPSTFNTTKLRGVDQTIGSETVSVLELDIDGYVLRATGTTVPTSTTAGYAKGALFIDTNESSGTEALYQNRGSNTSASFVQIKQGGGGGSGSLDDAYSNGRTITIDEGPVVLNDASAGALDTLQITKSGAGSGDLIQLSFSAADTGRAMNINMGSAVAATGILIDNATAARTGADILITADSSGVHSIFDINLSGSGAATVFDFDGTAAGSPGGSVLDLTTANGANLDTTLIKTTRGTGVVTVPTIDINDASTGSADIIDIDLTGVYTGDVFDFASSAAATGNVLNLLMTNAVAMTAIRIAGAGVRTEPFIELIGTQTGSAHMVDLSADGAFTGDVINMDLTTAVGGRGVGIIASGVRTANVIDITDDSTSNTEMIDINVTGINTGDIIDITYATAAATGTMLDLNLGTGVAAKALVITGGNAVRTSAMGLITLDGSGASAGATFLDINVTNTGATGSGVFDIDITGVYTGNILDITFGTAASTGEAISIAMGTNVAGSALVVTAAGARTDDLFKIDDSSTTSAQLFDINLTGAFTGGPAIDVNASAAHETGLMLLTSNSSHTGAKNLLSVINDNTLAVGAVPLHLQQDAEGTANFKTLIMLGTIGIYVSNQTSPNGALTAAEGSICLNGSATGQAFWNNDGVSSWVALA